MISDMSKSTKQFQAWIDKVCEANESVVKSFNALNTFGLISVTIFIILITAMLGVNKLVLFTYVLPLLGFGIAYYLNSKKLFGHGLFIVYCVSLIHGSIVVISYDYQFLELIYILIAIIPLLPFDNLNSLRIMYLLGFLSFNLFGFHFKNYSFFEIFSWPKSILIYFLLMNTVLIVLFQFFIGYKKNSLKYRLAIKNKNKEIEEQNELIKLNTKMLILSEKEKHNLELAGKQKDVEVLHINNHLKISMKNDLIKELQKVKKNEANIGNGIQSIILKLKHQIEEEKKIDLIQNNIDVVGSDFNDRIKQQFPDVTKSEIELLVYIKLKLSNKQIAIQNNTSPNSINVALHRLKTKCQFETTNELKEFVEAF
jgi:DNA-binding CsgD family transcriptional regulator